MYQANRVVNPFRGKASLVLRALMARPHQALTGTDLALDLKLSSAWVNRILTTLEEQGMVQRSGTGPKSDSELINPQELLKRWQLFYDFDRHRFHFYYVKVGEPLKRLQEVCASAGYRYALTGYAAANTLKKVIYDVEPMAYLSPPDASKRSYEFMLTRLENIHGFLPVKKGANLIIIESYLADTVLFQSSEQKGLRIVSPLQLYLDLSAIDKDGFTIKELSSYWKKHGILL